MTHSHVRRQLSAYLEGELGLREEELLEAHLIECAPCAAELRALRRAIELLRGLPVAEPSQDIGAAVMARLRAGEGQPRRSLWSALLSTGDAQTRWLAPLALTMGALALLWLAPSGAPPGLELPIDVADLSLPWATALIPPAPPAPTVPYRVPQPGQPGRELGASEAPVQPAASGAALPSISTCLELEKSGRECAGWDHWWVELALADARRFAYELNGLPEPVRGRLLHRLSEFAARSGSATMVTDELRNFHDPGAMRYARRFERGNGAGFVTAGWSGR